MKLKNAETVISVIDFLGSVYEFHIAIIMFRKHYVLNL